MNDKILFVDDDENLLAGFKRNLRKNFSLDTAGGGAEGLAALAQSGPYAVVVSDMRMPLMNGVQFLSKVREQSTDSVRVILTGQADMQDAVNEGNIFRFLTKPCDLELLAKTLRACLEQHHLINAERELLEKTLSGSIKTLIDIMALVNPIAFSRAGRLKRLIQYMANELQVADRWQLEMAALLSQIGFVTIPQDILKQYAEGKKLSEAENNMFAMCPSVAHDLLVNIPRLETIAKIITRQDESMDATGLPANPREWDPITLAAQMLKVAGQYDTEIYHHHFPHEQAIQMLAGHPKTFDPALVKILQSMGVEVKPQEIRQISIFELAPHMIMESDVRTTKGVLLVSKGQEVNETLIKFLKNYLNRDEIGEQVKVILP